MRKKNLIACLIIISMIGLALSSYMVYTHYHPSLEGSVCDIIASASCTVVNSGIYSKIAGIPVAMYGAIWFIMSGVLSWNSLNNKNIFPKLLVWNGIGFLSIFYFIYIEFLLDTICPSCTVVHVLVALSLVISIVLYKQFYISEIPPAKD